MVFDTLDINGTEVRQEWYCDAPPLGAVFRVIREDWDTESTPMVRRIFEVERQSAKDSAATR